MLFLIRHSLVRSQTLAKEIGGHRRASNPQPAECHSAALPIELLAHKWWTRRELHPGVMISYLSKLNEPADRKELPSYAAGDLPLGRPEVFFNSFRA